jgi:hypothetical protein
MTRAARFVITGAFVLVLGAAGVTTWTSVRATGDGAAGPPASTTSLSPAVTPTPTLTEQAAKAAAAVEPILTLEAANAALTGLSAGWQPAKQPVQLVAVCDGAVLASGADDHAVFGSLQTPTAPLRFLDVGITVYPDAEAATDAYVALVQQISACPASGAVAAPPGDAVTGQVTIQGAPHAVQASGRPAIQWWQLQSTTTPATSLRTAVTVVAYANAVVAVSMDEDSETTTPEALAEASRAAAERLLVSLGAPQ